jgi:hypothetical protein
MELAVATHDAGRGLEAAMQRWCSVAVQRWPPLKWTLTFVIRCRNHNRYSTSWN